MKQFEHMSEDSSRFLTRCINEVMLNEYAVKSGMFDKFIVNITNASDFKRWREILPVVAERMKSILATRN